MHQPESHLDHGRGSRLSFPRTVAVLGAGLMGADIAAEYAAAGCDVRITTSARTSPSAAVARVVERGALGPDSSVRWCATAGEAAVGADIVVESLPEDLEMKQRMLSEAQRSAPDALLCTNTSSLTVSRIAAPLPAPPSLVGTHYLNPPWIFSIVELVPGARTDEAVITRVERVLSGLGRDPIRLKIDSPGFVINRIQFAVIRESIALVDEGVVSPEDLDRIVSQGLGPRWAAAGPFATIALGGDELFSAVAAELYPYLSAASMPPATVTRRSFEADTLDRLRSEREVLLRMLRDLPDTTSA
jgi:3-hydroxybutyryl-CoA dehydrogenase